MAYGLMSLSDSVDNRARGGLRQAADFEQQRNRMNDQIDAADSSQKKSTAATVAGLGLDKALTSYYSGAEAAAATTKGAATASEIAASLEGAAAVTETAATATEVAAGLEAAGATAATTTAAAGTGTAVAGAAVAPAAAGAGAAAGGATTAGLALGPVGWTALAGMALYSFL